MSDLPARFLHRRIMNVAAGGVIESTNDQSGIQRQDQSLLADEGKDGVERFQNYGFSSHPLRGAETLTVFLGGGRDHGVILACDDRLFRIRGLAEGEVAIYSDEGDTIILKRNNLIEVVTKNLVIKASEKVRVETPRMEVTGDLIDHADEQPHDVQDMRTIFNEHVHGNVQPGGGTTSPPTTQQVLAAGPEEELDARRGEDGA
jgi:phage baseplate assembly protein V